MNPSNNYLFSINFKLYQKMNSLPTPIRADLLGYFEAIIENPSFTKGINRKAKDNSNTIHRINYNYRLELIALSVVKGEQKIIKFLSISDKTKLKQAIVVSNNFAHQIVDIDINTEQNNISLKPEHLKMFQGKSSVKISEKDFEIKSNDFYPYLMTSKDDDISLSFFTF